MCIYMYSIYRYVCMCVYIYTIVDTSTQQCCNFAKYAYNACIYLYVFTRSCKHTYTVYSYLCVNKQISQYHPAFVVCSHVFLDIPIYVYPNFYENTSSTME